MFRIRKDDISPALTRLIATARHPQPVLRSMGTTFKSITEGAFNSVGADMRPTAWPAKRDGNPRNLLKSTTLAHSFHLAVGDRTATVSTPVIYARIHQYGGVIKAKNGKALRFQIGGKWITVAQVTIPARPFFPVLGGQLTPAAERLILRAGERALARQAGAPAPPGT